MKACGARETAHSKDYPLRWLPGDLDGPAGGRLLTDGDVAEAQSDQPFLVLIQLVF